MRLSNRTRTWAEAGRRLWGDRKDSGNGDGGNSVAAWDAAFGMPLAPKPAPPQPEPMPDPEPAVAVASPALTGDPTQQLLTALGRFQRQVNLADTGAPAEAWVDNCIDQLIAGIQIAHVRGWKGVKEALTDTARVLQSYDEAGDAAGCVAFLHDGYEILCLMVGDLIVDNVRSGVMEKWRERYARAVSDLHHAGYGLIDDDSTGAQHAHRPASSPAAEAARPSNVTPFVPRAAAVETPVDEAPQALNGYMEDYDTEDTDDESDETDVPDVTYVTEESEDAEDDDETSPFVYAEDVDDEEELVEDEAEEIVEEVAAVPQAAIWEDEAEEEDEGPEAEVEAVVEVTEEVVGEDEDEDELEPSPFDEPALMVEVTEEEDEEEVLEAPQLVAEMEVLDEELEQEILEDVTEEEEEAAGLWMVPEVSGEEEEDEEESAAEPELDLFAEAQRAQHELFEYQDEDEEPAMEEVTAEAVPEIEDADAGEEEVEQSKPSEETPESILRHAQAAMLRGDVRDAKVLALQLAVNMAKLEAQKAVQIVQESVEKLMATDAAIEVADDDVAKAAQRLEQMSHARTTREHDLDIKRAGIAGLEKRGTTVESAIAKLDEQIAKLQMQREQELAKLQEVQSELEAERDDERIVAEDLDRLHEAEQAAKDTLELAHTRLNELREQRMEREQAREACEQMLARQRESAETISTTLETVLGGKN